MIFWGVIVTVSTEVTFSRFTQMNTLAGLTDAPLVSWKDALMVVEVLETVEFGAGVKETMLS